MDNRIVLPKISGFRIKGFHPIFRNDVKMCLDSGPYIILGGNGLGKTTLIQAIIYGLAGGTNNENIEEIKSLRWDHGYFRERLSSNQLGSNVEIEVDFAFGERFFSVRRGLRGPNVIGFRDGENSWVISPSNAQDEFSKCLLEVGGYKSEEDFSFLVHRLLYLPESRRLIAWDVDTQTRILMLLNQDVISANEFRERRKKLKEMDSRRRHIHVALGQAESQISSLMEYEDKNTDNDATLPAKTNDIQKEKQVDIVPIVSQLEILTNQLNSSSKQLNDISGDLSKVSSEIDDLREKIELTEAELINNFLKEEESEQNLAIHKLLISGICPVCGTQQLGLRDLARQNNINHRCVFCGSEEPQETNLDLATLRSQLAEKIRSQRAIEKEYINISNQYKVLQKQTEYLRMQVNEARFQTPVVNLTERHLPDITQVDLSHLRDQLRQQEAELLFQISEEQNNLSSDFEAFREAIDSRISHLRNSYQSYATQFLGLECELFEKSITVTPSDVPLSRFIPSFEGTPRENPDSCSEAQRFFLDIAFRMALIDFASSTQNEKASFICETPENALDLSYVSNVANMFEKFCNKGNNILLTANIQQNGLAQKIISCLPIQEKHRHLINMLDIGRLSKVQQDALPMLNEVISSMLK